MDIEPRHLRIVCAIADEGSITRAAAVLGISQPALTAQLRRIEDAAGAPLFARHLRGVEATALGQYLIDRGRAILAELDDLAGGLRQRAGGEYVRELRLGGVSGPIIVGLADRLAEAFPDRRVDIRAEYSPRLLLDLVATGRLDAAVVLDYPGHELATPAHVDSALVVTDAVCVAMGAGHALARLEELDLAELARESWVLPRSDGAGWPEYFLRSCSQAGFTPRVGHRVGETRLLHELLASGRGLVPCQATFPAPEGVVVRPLRGTPMLVRHRLLWHRDSPLAEHAGLFGALAEEAYGACAALRPRNRPGGGA
ncbi:LysR family transcriptional regulator [Actinorhabdospora filicis]|uniref:LysR family transcriptional regulator n=1 Tax=Actinorhabdospora filicis TaxID=1785913 RepID=A0A9W6W220_9ACTN|nr:LysR family transcriptional regulator [Actinorhabdospora filicis]GLZ76522.1 LysR family transcriptional regulator [Actinorhabdospora filicis]